MAMTAVGRSPVSLMNAASKMSLGSQLSPPQVAQELDAALSETSADGSTAVAVAARARQPELLRLLLELKAAPDTPDLQGNTALMLAAAAGEKNMVAGLLSAGAAVNAQNSTGFDALDLASNAEVRQMLQAEMDRSAVEKQVQLSKSCSLPSLKKSSSQSTLTATNVKPSGCRVRLDCLPLRASADHLEAEVWDTLKRYRVLSPLTVDVAVDPITLRSRGHAHLDYASADQAESAAARLIDFVDDMWRVTIE